MVDAKWKPDEAVASNENHNLNDKVYGEITSGIWYKRTYDKMILKHRRNPSPYPPLLIAIILVHI